MSSILPNLYVAQIKWPNRYKSSQIYVLLEFGKPKWLFKIKKSCCIVYTLLRQANGRRIATKRKVRNSGDAFSEIYEVKFSTLHMQIW